MKKRISELQIWKIVNVVGFLLIGIGCVIGLYSVNTMAYTLFIYFPLLVGLVPSYIFRRYMGVAGIAGYAMAMTIFTITASDASVLAINSIMLTLLGYTMIFFVSLILGKDGHNVMKTHIQFGALFIITYMLVILSFIFGPRWKVSIETSDTIINMYLNLFVILIISFSILYILTANLTDTLEKLALSKIGLNLALMFFTLSMFLILPVVYIMVAAACSGCGPCYTYISPVPTIFLLASIVTSTPLLLGHGLATHKIRKNINNLYR